MNSEAVPILKEFLALALWAAELPDPQSETVLDPSPFGAWDGDCQEFTNTLRSQSAED